MLWTLHLQIMWKNEGVSVPIWVLLAVPLLLTGYQWVRTLWHYQGQTANMSVSAMVQRKLLLPWICLQKLQRSNCPATYVRTILELFSYPRMSRWVHVPSTLMPGTTSFVREWPMEKPLLLMSTCVWTPPISCQRTPHQNCPVLCLWHAKCDHELLEKVEC